LKNFQELTDLSSIAKDTILQTNINFKVQHTSFKEALKENINAIKVLINKHSYNEASSLLKTNLKLCFETVNAGKYLNEEYELFILLAELYSSRGHLRDYPKATAIYEYLKVLIIKLNLPSTDHRKFNQDVQEKIANTEKKFIGNAFDIQVHLEKIEQYKQKLQLFREEIKEDLKKVEDLGIPTDKAAALDEYGLLIRATEMENIYKKIQANFIGEKGLFKELVEDAIEELGGIPKVNKKDGSIAGVEYALFSVGSSALCTMTPWSDYEGGILIEANLLPEDEIMVKNFFRKLATLFYIKIVSLGETLLRMMGIEELNDFKGTAEKIGEDWFFDDLIKSGINFDGPHLYACKTPLGREEIYYKSSLEKRFGIM